MRWAMSARVSSGHGPHPISHTEGMDTQMTSTDFVMVQTTTDSAEEAERLASAVVEQQLGACVQVSEIRSVYRWQGQTHQDPEYLLSIKTTSAAVAGLSRLLRQQHSYEEPEMVVLPIIDGSTGYLQWVAESINSNP